MFLQTGVCYDRTTDPPSAPNNDHLFVLCCMGSLSPRGQGQHCLRYNWTHPMIAFSIGLLGKLCAGHDVEQGNRCSRMVYPLTLRRALTKISTICPPCALRIRAHCLTSVLFRLSYPDVRLYHS